ncbi:efflux transporter outer membrane subunit [Cupriavidus basilensis]|uniref:efflux transporter outer membrane subunit n=1 Tax=Cupriavidus basilensis TaxID=68895 RepID=UPI00157B43A0|nr:efflux transporter outer membrane subunit [Cupriavidus basilensis]NUA26980.1 efflux transporter outer membrane subunit [Cupriavidus basilensis]
MRARLTAPALALAILLAGCAAGPDYKKPAVDLPVAWKLDAPWRESTPGDSVAKGDWWRRFEDPQLDALERQALAASPTLAAASARLAQARAQANAANAGLFPQIGASVRGQRQKISANRPLTNYAAPNYSTVQNDFAGSFTVNYEVDLAGRVQRTIEGAAATAQQSLADFENVRLLLTSDLAANYYNLRALDIELDVLRRSIDLQRRALELVSSRHELGAASGLDVAQQQALLDATLTQVDVLAKQRSQFEHAIATLTGTPAPLFTLAPDVKPLAPPAVPLGVPSDVLERRPDVAFAERAMAAANAQIGVATSAFYPSVMLGGALGVDSLAMGSVFNASSLLWSLGASAAATVFDGGRLRANLEFARAGYDGTVANYRRVVLGAMQEVEDGITGLASLARASDQQQRAVGSARRVLDMAAARYEGGATGYLDVITAQQGLLGAERTAAQLRGQQMLTAVFLVKALGGDWGGASTLAGGAVQGAGPVVP